MILSLYFDENTPVQVADGLRARGVDVITVEEDGLRSADDSVVLDRASQLRRILFTCDEDFLREVAVRLASGTPFATVVYVHQLDLSIGNCVTDLEFICKAAGPSDLTNQLFYLPL